MTVCSLKTDGGLYKPLATLAKKACLDLAVGVGDCGGFQFLWKKSRAIMSEEGTGRGERAGSWTRTWDRVTLGGALGARRARGRPQNSAFPSISVH